MRARSAVAFALVATLSPFLLVLVHSLGAQIPHAPGAAVATLVAWRALVALADRSIGLALDRTPSES